MRILPILFSTPMVVALDDGRKTQTRRLATSPLARGPVIDYLWVRETFAPLPAGHYAYKANGDDPPFRWKSALHMPRAASRLTLQVVSRHIEPLHEITGRDARAEGVADIEAYRKLWGNLHGSKSWDRNPRVVVLEFVVHRANIDAVSGEDDLLAGYTDGLDPASPLPSANRSETYKHGFEVGRADRRGKAAFGSAAEARRAYARAVAQELLR